MLSSDASANQEPDPPELKRAMAGNLRQHSAAFDGLGQLGIPE